MKNGREMEEEKEEGREMHYTFAYILACGDPEIKIPLTREFDKRFGSKGYFWLPELGGVKDLSSPDVELDRDRLIGKMREAYEIHPYGLIVLINHSNCGKYKLSGKSFEDSGEEERFHTEELKKAAEILKEEFPEKATEAHYFLKAEQRMAW